MSSNQKNGIVGEIVKEQKVELMEVESIIPYVNNPRKNDKAAEEIAELIKRFGFRYAIHVDKKNVIISGHTRLKSAKILGLKKVPVVVDADLSPDDVKALRLADNRSNELALWDDQKLGDELRELEQMGYDIDSLTFPEDELDQLLSNSEELLPISEDQTEKTQPVMSVVLGSTKVPVTDEEEAHFLKMLSEHKGLTGNSWGFVKRLIYNPVNSKKEEEDE